MSFRLAFGRRCVRVKCTRKLFKTQLNWLNVK